MLRALFIAFVLGLLLGTSAHAQLVEDYNPPRSNCCWFATAKTLADQMQDWNQLGRFHEADEQLMTQPPDPRRVVFLGDSITEAWRLEQSFPGKPYVNRGIGGQTTPQMLVRTYPDVVDLHPAAVIILAGTNDVAQNTGPETLTMVEENLMAITELAQRHGIKVILCAVMPVSDYTLMPPRRGGQGGAPGAGPTPPPMGAPPHHIQTIQRPPAQILQLDAWMKSYASSAGAVYADYYSAVVDDKGMFREGYSDDGLHPNAQGFALLVPIAEAAIEKALQ
jgi:lysophospholipase L1-like esterase